MGSIMENQRSPLQLVWGVALVLAGVGVFYKIPERIPEVLAAFEQLAALKYFVYFCFYLMGILLDRKSDKKGEVIRAHSGFMMVVSYNPGYQSVLKDLKQSTRQRFVSLAFDYPDPENEALIVAHEGGIDPATAGRLVALGRKIRRIREHGLTEGASTRLLIYAARLMGRGIPVEAACRAAICLPLTDDDKLQETLTDLIEDLF